MGTVGAVGCGSAGVDREGSFGVWFESGCVDEDGAEEGGSEVWRKGGVGDRRTREVMWGAQLPDGEIMRG